MLEQLNNEGFEEYRVAIYVCSPNPHRYLNKEERPERFREECKFVVIKSDLFELRIAMFILPTVVEGSFK